MHKTREEAITALSYCREGCKEVNPCPYRHYDLDDSECREKLIEDLAEVFLPSPRVLALEEAVKMRYGCFLEQKGWGMSNCQVACRWINVTTDQYFFETVKGPRQADLLSGDDYGITWRCWDIKPTDASKAATHWKEAT